MDRENSGRNHTNQTFPLSLRNARINFDCSTSPFDSDYTVVRADLHERKHTGAVMTNMSVHRGKSEPV